MVISLLLQAGFGFTPLESGLTNTPFSVGVLVASLIAGRFGSNYLRARVGVGAALLVVGIAWLHFVIAGVGDTIDHWWFLPPLFIAGIGLGLGFSASSSRCWPACRRAMPVPARASLQAFQQVGGAVGVALVGQIFFSILADAVRDRRTARTQAFVAAAGTATWYQIVSFALVIVAGLRSSSRSAHGRRNAARPPPPVPVGSRQRRDAWLADDQRAGAVFGEQLDQHHMRRLAVEDDHALDAILQRLEAGLDLGDHAARDRAVGDQRLGVAHLSSGISFLFASSTPSTSVRNSRRLAPSEPAMAPAKVSALIL